MIQTRPPIVHMFLQTNIIEDKLGEEVFDHNEVEMFSIILYFMYQTKKNKKLHKKAFFFFARCFVDDPCKLSRRNEIGIYDVII